MTTPPATVVATNLGGVVETPQLSESPYRVDADGVPYVPVGDGGIVLGVRLGDDVFGTDTDHAAPGACLVHTDQAARHALTSYACLGNSVLVRSGAAAGARGVVLGKRGELGRVIACFAPADLLRLAPGDAVVVRGYGQGAELPAPHVDQGVSIVNLDPTALTLLPVTVGGRRLGVGVRAVVPSHTAGNGVGRPVEQWDVDLQFDVQTAPSLGLVGVRLGDLVAVSDLDVRHNVGYRAGWTTVGIIVHGGSPQPGHGPGLMPVLIGPTVAFDLVVDGDSHAGLSEAGLLAHGAGS